MSKKAALLVFTMLLLVCLGMVVFAIIASAKATDPETSWSSYSHEFFDIYEQ